MVVVGVCSPPDGREFATCILVGSSIDKGLFAARIKLAEATELQRVDPVSRRADWSRASASRLHSVLIGCGETRTVSVRLVGGLE